MKAFESTGLWYLPSDPSTYISGTLKFSEKDGLKLLLAGTLSDPANPSFEVEYPVIHGFVQGNPNGKAITLSNSKRTRTTFSIPGFATEEIRSSVAFLSNRSLQDIDLRFNELHVRFDCLDDWFHFSGITTENKNTTQNGFSFSANYNAPAPIEIVAAGKTMRISSAFSYSVRTHNVELQEEKWLEIAELENLTIWEILDEYVYKFQNLFTFATNIANGISKLVVFNPTINDADAATQVPINVAFCPIQVSRENTESRKIHPIEMPFSFLDIQNGISMVVENWMDFYRMYRPFCNVYFGLQYAPPKFLDTKLLQLIIALNLFFRLSDIPISAESKLIAEATDEAVECFSTVARGSIPLLLPRMTELSFPANLLTVLKKHATLLNPLVSGDAAGFIKELLEMRSYIVHRDGDQPMKEAWSQKLFRFNEILSLILRICILEKLGFSREFIGASVEKRDQAYGHLASRN